MLLGFGEITITRYLDGYVPTRENSKLLKMIYSSQSDYYSILQMNKNNISKIAFNKSLKATIELLDVQTSDDVIFEISKYIINKIDVIFTQKIGGISAWFDLNFSKKRSAICTAFFWIILIKSGRNTGIFSVK